MTKTAKSHRHKRKPVAHHHRQVHHSFGILMTVIWIVVIVCSAVFAYRYFTNHRAITIDRNGIVMKVSRVQYTDIGTPPFDAPPGWKYVIVDVTVTNHRTSVFNFAPVIQTHIVGGSGQQYGMSPAILKNPIAAGPMQPGSSLSGSLSYLVPITSQNNSFEFNP